MDLVDEITDLHDLAHSTVFREAMRLTGWDREAANDLVQEAFCAAVTDWTKLRSEPIGAQIAWLKQVCWNKQTDLWRREGVQRRKGELFRGVALSGDPEQLALDRWLVEAIRDEVATMPEKQRHVTMLHLFADLPLNEVAERLGMAAATARVHYKRSRERLERLMDQLYEEEPGRHATKERRGA